MPRTPRSRSEIEAVADEVLKQARGMEYLAAQLSGLTLEVVLDIRDAVMEGRERGPNESADINHN